MHILVLAINIYHSFDIYIKIPDKCMPRVNSWGSRVSMFCRTQLFLSTLLLSLLLANLSCAEYINT